MFAKISWIWLGHGECEGSTIISSLTKYFNAKKYIKPKQVLRSINLKKFKLSQSFRISWEDADKRFMQIVSNIVSSKALEERNLILKNDFETFRIKIKFSLMEVKENTRTK